MTVNEGELPVLSISDITRAIKNSLEESFPSVWLQGEVSNATLHTSGHYYFTLKDKQAQIGAVMFKGHASRLSKMPKNGDQVMVHGAINVYPPSGRYQIVADTLRPVGVGQLLAKLEELKSKLLKKGYFKPEHKKELPKFPKTIGVVTSPTGAAIQDILNILTRRFSGFHLILNPVKVQGAGAAEEIAEAIRQFNTYKLADVIIVGRGGGSLEDLWAFNEECVADAIYQSKIPIVCAVGHETDHAIAEYTADLRAPTPSAAAEIVMGERGQLIQNLMQTKQRLDQALFHLLRQDRQRLESLKRHPLLASPYPLLGPWMQRLDQNKAGLDQTIRQILSRQKVILSGMEKAVRSLNPRAQIGRFRERLFTLGKQMDRSIGYLVKQKRENYEKVAEKLILIDPKNLLGKGYAILFSEGKVIKSVKEMTAGSRFVATLHDGSAEATVDGLF